MSRRYSYEKCKNDRKCQRKHTVDILIRNQGYFATSLIPGGGTLILSIIPIQPFVKPAFVPEGFAHESCTLQSVVRTFFSKPPRGYHYSFHSAIQMLPVRSYIWNSILS
jgi:hypothetical protein